MWASLDQALYSLSNLLLTATIARASSPQDFGLYATVLAAMVLTAGFLKAAIVDPMVVRGHGAAIERALPGVDVSGGQLILGGMVVGVGLGAWGLASAGTVSAAAWTLILVSPLFTLVDNCRHLAIGAGLSRRAALLDGTWLAVQVVVLCATFVVAGRVSGLAGALAWAAGLAVAGVLAWMYLRPTLKSSLLWERAVRDKALAGGFLGEYLSLGLVAQAPAFILVSIAGLDAVAAFKGAQTLYAPATVALAGLRSAAIPSMVRLGRLGLSRQVRRRGYLLGGGLAVATAAYGSMLMLLPDELVEEILGASGALSGGLVLPLLVQRTSSALLAGPIDVLRANRQVYRTAMGRAGMAASTICLLSVGAWWGGAEGAAWGLALGTSLWLPFWFRQGQRSTFRSLATDGTAKR